MSMRYAVVAALLAGVATSSRQEAATEQRHQGYIHRGNVAPDLSEVDLDKHTEALNRKLQVLSQEKEDLELHIAEIRRREEGSSEYLSSLEREELESESQIQEINSQVKAQNNIYAQVTQKLRSGEALATQALADPEEDTSGAPPPAPVAEKENVDGGSALFQQGGVGDKDKPATKTAKKGFFAGLGSIKIGLPSFGSSSGKSNEAPEPGKAALVELASNFAAKMKEVRLLKEQLEIQSDSGVELETLKSAVSRLKSRVESKQDELKGAQAQVTKLQTAYDKIKGHVQELLDAADKEEDEAPSPAGSENGPAPAPPTPSGSAPPTPAPTKETEEHHEAHKEETHDEHQTEHHDQAPAPGPASNLELNQTRKAATAAANAKGAAAQPIHSHQQAQPL